MFKPGDRIKCITNEDCLLHLDLTKTYIFMEYFDENSCEFLIIESDQESAYLSDRFRLDQAYYRKEKLKNLKN